jgi:hypothetical protein
VEGRWKPDRELSTPLEFSEPVVSRVMDGVQRYIANASAATNWMRYSSHIVYTTVSRVVNW